MKKKHHVFLLQGSNKNNRKKYLDDSLNLIQKNIGEVTQKSSYFKSKSWNMKKETPIFYNRVLHVKTLYSPIFILNMISDIEKIHPIFNKSILEILGLCSDSLIVKKINISNL